MGHHFSSYVPAAKQPLVPNHRAINCLSQRLGSIFNHRGHLCVDMADSRPVTTTYLAFQLAGSLKPLLVETYPTPRP